ncbi:MAG: copper-translocating P-type ATPase [Gemmatimonadales bacterium]|jgi:Cu2+-exporting ATPase|nr:MAG: copper-translocating P-type ATPase [Gemmatimonadales bacterium]
MTGHDKSEHHQHADMTGHQPATHDHASMMADPNMAKEMERDMRRRFWVALAFTIPVTLIAGHIPGVPMLIHPPLAGWVELGLSVPVVWWAGWIFISGSYHALKNRKLDMSVLIATGVLAAWLSSLYLTIIAEPTSYYEAACMLVTFVLFGHWMEMKSRRGTSDALRALFDLVPPTARVLRNGKEVEVPTSDVVVGDLLRLRPGDKIPVDGELTEGETDVDEALVTGESLPVKRNPGDALVGGAINVSSAVTMRATRVGKDTVLAQIADLVSKAQNSKAPRQRLADKAAAILVVVAVSAGVLTFAGWSLLADVPFLTALTFSISAVVIACPDALGLATPTAVAVGTGLGAKHNILIKDAATLESLSRIETLVLDKTGTLTEGKPSVTEVLPAEGHSVDDALSRAASLAGKSTHPLSRAISAAAEERHLAVDQVAEVADRPGKGIEGLVKGGRTLLGNGALLEEAGVDTGLLAVQAADLAAQGRSLVWVASGGAVVGVIGITDAIRPTSAGAIEELKAMGIEPVLMSGDLRETAERVARSVGIARVLAEVRPEQKAERVKALQAEGRFVAMVGDGVNDAPALAQADIGIAIGSGTDVAVAAAQVVLMRSDPADIARAIRLSKATVRKMKQNLAWASVYNLLAIPVAAGVFYNSLGWSLRPEVSALLMSASSIIVALNAVSLRRARI